MLIDETDAPEIVILSQTRPVSRKDRLCDICLTYIHKGEKYIKDVYLEDGKFGQAIRHEHWKDCVKNMNLGLNVPT